jgi:hypothetical protein
VKVGDYLPFPEAGPKGLEGGCSSAPHPHSRRQMLSQSASDTADHCNILFVGVERGGAGVGAVLLVRWAGAEQGGSWGEGGGCLPLGHIRGST